MSDKRDLIQQLVKRGRTHYGELKQEEKRAVVSCVIRERRYADKASLLVDADKEMKLPDLVADIISLNGTLESAIPLMNELMDIFVRRDAYFADEIDEALEDEMREQPVQYIDDVRRQDAAERARDVRKAV